MQNKTLIIVNWKNHNETNDLIEPFFSSRRAKNVIFARAALFQGEQHAK